MRKSLKISFLLGCVLFVTACSFDSAKNTAIDGVKSALTVKNDIIITAIPNGDQTVVIDGKEITVSADTLQLVEELVSTNTELNKKLVDLVGSQITQENITTIAYYIEKTKIPAKDFLSILESAL